MKQNDDDEKQKEKTMKQNDDEGSPSENDPFVSDSDSDYEVGILYNYSLCILHFLHSSSPLYSIQSNEDYSIFMRYTHTHTYTLVGLFCR